MRYMPSCGKTLPVTPSGRLKNYYMYYTLVIRWYIRICIFYIGYIYTYDTLFLQQTAITPQSNCWVFQFSRCMFQSSRMFGSPSITFACNRNNSSSNSFWESICENHTNGPRPLHTTHRVDVFGGILKCSLSFFFFFLFFPLVVSLTRPFSVWYAFENFGPRPRSKIRLLPLRPGKECCPVGNFWEKALVRKSFSTDPRLE